MNSVHDLGGMDGFGKVTPEPDHEPPFHAPWEGRVLAMSRAFSAMRFWNIDQSRFVVEQMNPVEYLASSYYRKWHLRNRRQGIDVPSFISEIQPNHSVRFFSRIGCDTDLVGLQRCPLRQSRDTAAAAFHIELPSVVWTFHKLTVESSAGQRHATVWTEISHRCETTGLIATQHDRHPQHL